MVIKWVNPTRFWKYRGWFVNSLRFQVEKHVDNWLDNNDSFREYRWRFLEKGAMARSSSPIYFLFSLLVAFTINIIGLYYLIPPLRILLPSWNSLKELVAFSGNIFSGQLAIIGLIFPLVISSVGLLIRNKSADRALWHIYSRYSGFMSAGLSSLLLVVIIAASNFLSLYANTRFTNCLSVGFLFWMLYNLYLTGYFLWATAEFISQSKRKQILIRYCLNEEFILEVKWRLANSFASMSTYYGLLSKSENMYAKVNNLTVHINDDNSEVCQRTFGKNKYIRNIYFRPLNIFVLWEK